jgi:hypothetical protein
LVISKENTYLRAVITQRKTDETPKNLSLISGVEREFARLLDKEVSYQREIEFLKI